MDYVYYNENPAGRNVGDCTVRAISKALDCDWLTAYLGLCIEGAVVGDMPSANAVWGSFLDRRGFDRALTPDGITVEEFADDNPRGVFILALSGHVVCIVDGVLYDSWDSRNEIVIFYWMRGAR